MSFVISALLTALAVSPVFVLAGWLGPASRPVPVHARFNSLTARRF